MRLLVAVLSERRRRLRAKASLHRTVILSRWSWSQPARLAQACEGGVSISASLARRIGRSTVQPKEERRNASHGPDQGDGGERGRGDAEPGAAHADGQLQRGAGQGRRDARRGRAAPELEGRAGG